MKPLTQPAKPSGNWNWKTQTRAALSGQLEEFWRNRHAGDWMSAGHSAISADTDDPTLNDHVFPENDGVENGDAPQTPGPAKLQLPWMPKKSFVPRALAVFALGRCLQSPQMLARLARPTQLSVFRVRDVGGSEREFRTAVQSALKLWLAGPALQTGTVVVPAVIFAPSEQDASIKRSRSAQDSFRRDIQERLASGEPVLAVVPGRFDLGDDLAAFCGLEFDPPPVDREVLVELGRLLHAKAGRLSRAGFVAALPEDTLLRNLAPLQIEIALRDPDPKSMFEQLHRYATPKPTRRNAVRLEAIHGQDKAVQVFRRMIRDLERWKSGELVWGEASMSAVMFGPPGNGKTSLAAAFAGSADIPLIATSYADCQRHGHQGDMLNALHKAFEKAEESVPAVLFIDEIDSFLPRGEHNGSDSYMRGIVNGLLAELSRAAQVPGLVVLGATNHLSSVDPAVIRPGRFDLKIPVTNPDPNGIRRILLDHLSLSPQTDFPEEDLDAAIRDMTGLSGADVAGKAREALGLARDAGRSVNLADLNTERSGHRSVAATEELYRVAVHEAGHLVLNALSELPPAQSVQISHSFGVVEAHQPALFTLGTGNAYLRFLLAGRAAERLVLGQVSSGGGNGVQSDLARATFYALKMECEWGLLDPPLWRSAEVLLANGIPVELQPRIESRLADASRETDRMLEGERELLLHVASELFRRRDLNAFDLAELFKGLRRDADPHCGAGRAA